MVHNNFLFWHILHYFSHMSKVVYSSLLICNRPATNRPCKGEIPRVGLFGPCCYAIAHRVFTKSLKVVSNTPVCTNKQQRVPFFRSCWPWKRCAYLSQSLTSTLPDQTTSTRVCRNLFFTKKPNKFHPKGKNGTLDCLLNRTSVINKSIPAVGTAICFYLAQQFGQRIPKYAGHIFCFIGQSLFDYLSKSL